MKSLTYDGAPCSRCVKRLQSGGTVTLVTSTARPWNLPSDVRIGKPRALRVNSVCMYLAFTCLSALAFTCKYTIVYTEAEQTERQDERLSVTQLRECKGNRGSSTARLLAYLDRLHRVFVGLLRNALRGEHALIRRNNILIKTWASAWIARSFTPYDLRQLFHTSTSFLHLGTFPDSVWLA